MATDTQSSYITAESNDMLIENEEIIELDTSKMTKTENGAICLESTSNCFVDAFGAFVRGIDTDSLCDYMNKCWINNPKKTVALVFNTRDRKNGKKEKNLGIRSMIWLRKNKNKTYQKNMQVYLQKYGCWKDINYISRLFTNNSYELDMFVNQLVKDKNDLDNNKEISLCAKWAPTENGKSDKIAKGIATLLFMTDKKIMERYRKEYLSPLRKKLDIVERKMVSNDWNSINYNSVPAVAMRRLNKAFSKHDQERFSEYIESIKSGEKKMKVTGILPHELVKYYLDGGELNDTIELQWKSLVDNVKSKGNLGDMVAIVDASGSMYSGTDKYVSPIEVSIALGILISECTTGYFANKVISFSELPVFHDIIGNNLFEKVKNIVEKLPVGLNTDFEAIFDVILKAGQTYGISKEFMPKKIVCISDMQFDCASSCNDVKEETLHNTIVKKYENTGYDVPMFIYWNVCSVGDKNFPVDSKTDKVAMISGFSEQLLNIFMDNQDFNPENIVDAILSDYMNDVIIDDSDI